MKKIARILPFAGVVLPWMVLAQDTNGTGVDFGWLTSLVNAINGLITLLLPVVIAIGLLFFIWGLVQYIASSGDEAAKEEGKRKMIWGIIALFVIVSVWGLVNLLQEITGVGAGTVTTPSMPPAPGAPTATN